PVSRRASTPWPSRASSPRAARPSLRRSPPTTSCSSVGATSTGATATRTRCSTSSATADRSCTGGSAASAAPRRRHDRGAGMTVTESTVVAFTLNGSPVAVCADHPHLLAALREELDVTSPKDGCSPSGQCGCCTVLVDGKALVACQQSLAKVAGRSVVTLEGFTDEERQRFADAFAACGGLQCGFCIPGIVVRAKALIDKRGADLSRADAARHLGAHLCRCTGYVKILDAVE